MRRSSVRAGLAACLLAMAVAPLSARADDVCGAAAPGGEWRSFGRDLSNTRTQSDEHRLVASQLDDNGAAHLEKSWAFATTPAGVPGNFQSTPVVADGCVYLGTSAGSIVALNADTGAIAWAKPVATSGLLGGIFGVSVPGDGRVYANVSGTGGPFAVALDQATGDPVWQSEPIETAAGYYTNASAVVFDEVMIVGISGSEGDATQRGSVAFIDTADGSLITKTYIIPDADFASGFGGGGIWSTAVVDTEGKYAYVGAGNPYGPLEHRYTNAILKLDVDRARPTFGAIVDAYKGNTDQYYPPLTALAKTPACTTAVPATVDYLHCGQIDLDFGASPNLFRTSSGELTVGVLQKSGVFHAAFTDTMQQAWSSLVGAPCALCNASSSASDGTTIYAVGTPGGVLIALDVDSGSYKWTTPLADGVHYQGVTVANGVVYVVDTKGSLSTFDAATGAPVFVRSMSADAGDACASLSGGVAVARGRVYAVCDIGAGGGGWVISYSID